MASEDFIQAINEHVMGNCSEFTALTKRFKNFDACTGQPAAAALGYLIAKGELEAEKEEEEEEPDAYDKVVEIINRFDNQRVNSLSPHSATDQIFTLIYEWLDKELIKVVYRDGGVCTADVELLFRPFVIAKPKA
jgi:hypothetical protein